MSKKYNPAKTPKFFLIFGLGFLFAAFLCGWGAYYFIQRDARYEREGMQSDGNIVNKNITQRWDSDRKRNENVYNITYSFKTAEGQTIEHSTTVGSEAYEKYSSGDPIKIEYIPSEPDMSRPFGTSDTFGGILISGFALITFLIGAGSLYSYVKRVRMTSMLMRSGQTGEGLVSAVQPGSVTINNVTQWQVHYTFTDMLGRSHQGKSPHMPPEQATAWNVGDKGKVRFDKNDPSNNLWMG